MRAIIFGFVCFAAALSLQAEEGSTNFNRLSHNTAAIDAKGARLDGSAYKGAPPWLADRTGGSPITYPADERAKGHEGQAIVRLILNVNTGQVVGTKLLQSSGYRALDESALTAFGNWRWRAGKWKNIDLPVAFSLGDVSSRRTTSPGSTHKRSIAVKSVRHHAARSNRNQAKRGATKKSKREVSTSRKHRSLSRTHAIVKNGTANRGDE